MSDPSGPPGGGFAGLSPEIVMEAVQAAFGVECDGSIAPYSSYVNRVYGLKAADGESYVAKFYRPGRWTADAILDEHDFILECADAELPVAVPLPSLQGSTLAEIEIEIEPAQGDSDADAPFAAAPAVLRYALYRKKGGRGFDAERDGDWLRLGSLAGRMHAVGSRRAAPHRATLDSAFARANLALVLPEVHPEFRAEFGDLCALAIGDLAGALDSMPRTRIHGDLHRGNILERPGEGLLVLDFDDMMTGPAAQDLWMLLPGPASECAREWSLVAEGYSGFADLPRGSLALVEPLRLLRMLHFLAWRMRQRGDAWFAREFPDWGGRAFWLRELEDFRDQARRIGDDA